MDLRNTLKLNQLVHIEILDHKGEGQRYSSRVENLTVDRIALASPLRKRIPVFVPTGNFVTVFFSDNMTVFSFRSRVVANVPERLSMLILEAPDTLEKIQKREYVRVPINLNALFSFKNEEDEIKEVWLKTRDLSGGGLMLVSNKAIAINKGAKVSLTFQLESENISTNAELMRIFMELDISGIERQILGVKFLNLSEKNRQTIIKFLFQRQIDLRKRGLL